MNWSTWTGWEKLNLVCCDCNESSIFSAFFLCFTTILNDVESTVEQQDNLYDMTPIH